MPSPPEHLFIPSASQTCSSQKAKEPDLREMIRERDRQARQRKLDDAAARRKAKKQLEVVRGERSRLNSLAIVEQDREVWRLQDEARAIKLCEQKRLRDEAGIRAGGAYKRPPGTQQAVEPHVKKRLVQLEERRSR